MRKSSRAPTPHHRPATSGIILDLRGVPATPERLLALVGGFPASIGATTVLRFGDHFPWSFDERLRSPYCYPEEVVNAASAAVARAGGELVPAADLITGLHELCHPHSYRRVTSFLQNRNSFRSAAPGAAALAGELLQDLLTLFPDSRHVYLGGECSGCIGADIEDFAAGYLMPTLRAAAEAQRIPVLHENCLGRCTDIEVEMLRGQREAVVVVVLDGEETAQRRSLRYRNAGYEIWLAVPAFTQNRGTLQTRPEVIAEAGKLRPGWARILVECRTTCGFFEAGGLLLEEYAAFLPSTGDVRADRIARRLADFRTALDECWVWLRRLRETLVIATHDPRKRTGDGFGTARFLNLVRLNVGAARLHAHETQELTRGRVDGSALSRTLFEQLAPVEEELAILEERVRQLGSYPA